MRVGDKKVSTTGTRGKYDTVMMIDSTPGGILKKKIQTAARKNKIRVKIVERVGTTIKKLLQRSRPFKQEKCNREDCIPCKTGIDCRTRGCVYRIECKECGKRYKGQTGRSVYERCGEHEEDFKKKMDRCPLWRHSKASHNKQKFDYEVKVEAKCFGKPSKRLITESVLIEEMTVEETMNSKCEWSYHKLQKVRLDQ